MYFDILREHSELTESNQTAAYRPSLKYFVLLPYNFYIFQPTASKAEEKKKVSNTATNSGDKPSSSVVSKKKPITQKPGVPQKDSKSGVMRTSSTRQKDSAKNVTKPKTSEPENTSLPSNEGKKKPKSEPAQTR